MSYADDEDEAPKIDHRRYHRERAERKAREATGDLPAHLIRTGVGKLSKARTVEQLEAEHAWNERHAEEIEAGKLPAIEVPPGPSLTRAASRELHASEETKARKEREKEEARIAREAERIAAQSESDREWNARERLRNASHAGGKGDGARSVRSLLDGSAAKEPERMSESPFSNRNWRGGGWRGGGLL